MNSLLSQDKSGQVGKWADEMAHFPAFPLSHLPSTSHSA